MSFFGSSLDRRATIVVVVATISFLLGWSAGGAPPPEKIIKPSDAFPLWMAPSPICVPATEDETQRLELAVRALDRSDSMTIGAMKLLGHGIFRQEDEVCAPPELMNRAQEAVTQHELFGGRLVEYDFDLAARFAAPSSYVVNAVAGAAFAAFAQNSELDDTDIRPMARSVLAGFGERAAAYSDIAFGQMSAEDALGTSAAQIAAATGHPEALRRIQELMDGKLRKFPRTEVIPWDTKKRLYELAYALVLAGAKSRPFIAPMQDLMTRNVESHALQFGMVPLRPKFMCWMTDRIEPGLSSAYDYCANPREPMDR